MTVMALLLASFAFVLHGALVLWAAPVVGAVADRVAMMTEGGIPAAGRLHLLILQPWRHLRRLMGKTSLRGRGGSSAGEVAPFVALAATLSASMLIPSFAVGTVTAPAADLPAILALLGLARAARIFGAMDANTAASAAAAIAASRRTLLVVPACLLCCAVLFLVDGGTNLDAALWAAHAGPGLPGRVMALVLVGLSLAAVALTGAGEGPALTAERSGPDLAMALYQEAAERLAWIDLASACLLPQALCDARSGLLWWLPALLFWAARLLLAGLLLGAARGLGGLLPFLSRRSLAGLALLLALLAPVFALTGRGLP